MGSAHTLTELSAMRPHGGYRAILADCPWLFKNRSEKGELKNPNQHYECLPMEDMMSFPVEVLAASDAAIFLWGTSPMLDQQITLMKSWQFRYVGVIPWCKESKNSGGLDTDDPEHKWTFGPGYWFRSAAEFLIVGVRGAPRLLPTRTRVRNLIYAPVREHSRKPDQQYEIIEALLPGPYLELFSRASRIGWDHFGNEAGKYDSSKRDLRP